MREARPVAAARRAWGERVAVSAAAVANHSRPWFALRLSFGRRGSQPGQWRDAMASKGGSAARKWLRRARWFGAPVVRSMSGVTVMNSANRPFLAPAAPAHSRPNPGAPPAPAASAGGWVGGGWRSWPRP